uniref:Uncharacterized protein n=1 Tax=Gopherus evgoodei TaxID=1825980 RepID=A0A8C4WEK9_9SAUR
MSHISSIMGGPKLDAILQVWPYQVSVMFSQVPMRGAPGVSMHGQEQGLCALPADLALSAAGLLEDERLASARQAEIFTKQIQRLQAQMRTLKDEFSSLQETKALELEQVERELQEANEEIHGLRLEAEEVAAIHENEIAALQEQLCRLRAELQRVQQVREEYETEITTLRAEITMKGSGQARAESHADKVAMLQEELLALREQYRDLMEEYQTLQESNKIMVHQLENLEGRQGGAGRGPSFRPHRWLGSGPASCSPPQRGLEPESSGDVSLRFNLFSLPSHLHPPPPPACGCRPIPFPALPHRAAHPRCPVISLPLIGLVVIVALLWCWWAETSS